MELKILPYSEGLHLIQDADILLFRHPSFPAVGWWIAKYGETPYSHVGIANWNKNRLCCAEFREFIGSRNDYLINQLYCKNQLIDVYRVSKVCTVPYYNDGRVSFKTHKFDYFTAKKIVEEAKTLIGKPYNWKTIFRIAKTYIPFVRLFTDKTRDRNLNELPMVCSTLINNLYKKHFKDLVPFIADEYTAPGDIARSSDINYLFTLRGSKCKK